MAQVRVGVIGAGGISTDHCDGVSRHPQATLVAVADLSAARAKAVASKYNIARTYTRYEDLLADRDVDAVCVALPNYLHAPVTIAALKAGKHVLCEKPFSTNFADAKKAADAAKKSKKTLMVGMNLRFNHGSQMLRAMSVRGDLGDIYHGKARYLRRAGCPRFQTWFGHKKLSGGGALYDIGVHVLDLCLHLMNNWEPVAVSGAVYTKFGNRGLGEGGWGLSDRDRKLTFDVDDFSTALIKFKNGASVELNASWALHLPDAGASAVEIYGTDAGASALPDAKLYRLGKKAGEYEVVTPQNVAIPSPACNRQQNWLNAILGTEAPICRVEESLVIQKILDGIYQSATSGKETRLR